MKEKFLLAQIQQQRNEAAFDKLYETLVDPIYRFVYFKVSHKELAQDLTSEVFIRVWKGLVSPEQKQVRHLRAYTYQIARSLVVDHYRQKAKHIEEPLEKALYHASAENLHEKVLIDLESQEVFKYIRNLKESYQEVLVLKYVEEFSLTEIAPILDKSPVATRVLLHRAHKALKREYERITPTSQE